MFIIYKKGIYIEVNDCLVLVLYVKEYVATSYVRGTIQIKKVKIMTVKFQGNPISVSGDFPQPGDLAPSFTLCSSSFEDITIETFLGKKVILNIFPSIDTNVCAKSVREFNQRVSKEEDVVVLCVSADLPFALSRFCTDERLNDVTIGSFFRAPEFTESYGVNINEGGLRGLAARAVIVLNEKAKVIHSELVSEVTNEPDYSAAFLALK